MNNNYLKYKSEFKKQNIFSIIIASLTLALVLMLIFLPVFQYEYKRELTDEECFEILTLGEKEIKSKYNLNTEERMEEFLEDGIVTEYKNFSIFNDFLSNVKSFDTVFSKNPINGVLFIYTIFEIFYGAMLIAFSVKDIVGYSTSQNDDSYLLKYTEIKKSGGIKQKKNFFQKQTIYTLLSFIFVDILISKVYAGMFDGMFSDMSHYLTFLSRVSFLIILPAMLLVAIIVLKILKNNLEKKVMIGIAKEELKDEVQQNKPETTEN